MTLTTAILTIVIMYLWVTGGLGWIDSYEARETITKFRALGVEVDPAAMPFVTKVIIMVAWPLMAGISGTLSFIDDVKEIYRDIRNGSS